MKKIINDPVHGFIDIPDGLTYGILEHPYFQRLRNIKQMGLAYLVYPGACHSRLSHALGAMHLMRKAIAVLRSKGNAVSAGEEEAACCAMLLHDLGHGPFSHALEQNVLTGIGHEQISLALVRRMNQQMDGALETVMAIMDGTYPKRFLHQLVSGQLDVDRLDYLCRDSFYSGVAEGMIGLERIIQMMAVRGDELVVEAKGIYSIEKFLISRHLMYWQVYLHKTVVAAEELLVQILHRARTLVAQGQSLPMVPALLFFLTHAGSEFDLENPALLDTFVQLDDADIDSAIKCWRYSSDKVLSLLSGMLCNRHLPKIEFSSKPFPAERLTMESSRVAAQLGISNGDIDYFVRSKMVMNKGYDIEEKINILMRDATVKNIYDFSDLLSARPFSEITKKYFLCAPKSLFA